MKFIAAIKKMDKDLEFYCRREKWSKGNYLRKDLRKGLVFCNSSMEIEEDNFKLNIEDYLAADWISVSEKEILEVSPYED